MMVAQQAKILRLILLIVMNNMNKGTMEKCAFSTEFMFMKIVGFWITW